MDNFMEWISEFQNKEQLLAEVQELRKNHCIYGDKSEYLEGTWGTWDEYVDQVAGWNFGYLDIFHKVIAEYKNIIDIPDNELDLYFDLFIDYLKY